MGWPEALQALGIVAGWSLVTWALASLTVWQAWPLSAGAFLLSLVGWRHLGLIVREGLYALTRGGR